MTAGNGAGDNDFSLFLQNFVNGFIVFFRIRFTMKKKKQNIMSG